MRGTVLDLKAAAPRGSPLAWREREARSRSAPTPGERAVIIMLVVVVVADIPPRSCVRVS